MSEAKIGEAFVKHEFDEAIAIQQVIVDAETRLATTHPMRSAKAAIKESLVDDRRFLAELKALGKKHDATGEVEDVAGGLKELMEQTLSSATGDGADSDYYEAHAVLLNLKRKQMDSAGGMRKIAGTTRETELRKAATAFERAQKASSKVLASELAEYAAVITRATRN
jgi:delta 1-pyrroline-5-carboxylate dehydrogenase